MCNGSCPNKNKVAPEVTRTEIVAIYALTAADGIVAEATTAEIIGKSKNDKNILIKAATLFDIAAMIFEQYAILDTERQKALALKQKRHDLLEKARG